MNPNALPDKIKEAGRFCCWRYEQRNDKQTKVPYHPITGERAKSNDPDSFTGFQEAVAALNNGSIDGLGIGMMNGVCAIDLDHCIDDSGTYSLIAREIVDLMHSYTERSPSGKGLHILFEAKNFAYDTQRYYIMNHAQGIEIYVAGVTNKYVTVTGDGCTQHGFGDRSHELQLVLDKFMRRPEAHTPPQTYAGNAINAVNSSVLSDDELLKLAGRSKNGAAFQRLWSGDLMGYASHSEADMAFCSHLAFWTGKDAGQMDRLFRKSGLIRPKWDRAQSGTTYGAITIKQAIAYCTEVYQRPEKVQQQITFPAVVPLKPQYSDLPSFPVDCLPETLKSYVNAVAAHSQTSPDMAAVIGLGTLAVCLQGKYQVQGMPGYVEPLSLYTVVIASPGERKSSVMRDMTGPLYEYEQELNKARAPAIRENQQERESLERRINAKRKALEHKPDARSEAELHQLEDELAELPEVRSVRFFADDCSSEALTSLLAANEGRFAVLSTEGGIFDIMAGRYSSKVNIDVWLKGHCGDTIRVDRLGRQDEYVPHPTLSAILTIQPSVLDEIMENTTMTGRGLIARFLYASPPSQIGKRVYITPSIPPEVAAAYRNQIFSLMALPAGETPTTLTLSARAEIRMAIFFQQHEQYLICEGQDISDWANKHVGSVLRIAGLLHAAEAPDHQREISEETLLRAIQIGAYFLAHARYAYSMMGTDLSIQKANFVLGKLHKKGIAEIKRQDLFQLCRGKFFKKTEEIIPTLELLEEHGYLRLDQPVTSGVGRPPDMRVIVNPEGATT